MVLIWNKDMNLNEIPTISIIFEIGISSWIIDLFYY